MINWNNKNVVYVGDLSGNGLQIVQVVVQKSIKNLVLATHSDNVEVVRKLQSLNGNVNITVVLVNVADHSSVKKAAQQIASQLGHVDVLINGVGVLADKDVETTIAVNLTGVINITLALMPQIDKTQSGQGGIVVNIASVYGLEPGPAFSVYTAAKHGVVGFTRSMANETLHRKTGVSFIAVCPGLTNTELMIHKRENNWLKWIPHSEELFNTVVQTQNTQTPEQWAKHIVNVIEQGKNGSVWISSKNALKEITPTVYWTN